MHTFFAEPWYLWLLACLPLLAFRVNRGLARQRREWITLGLGLRRRGEGAIGWLVVMVLLVLALAQPRWGHDESQVLPPGHDVVFLMDTSRSMGAEDAVPNRLGLGVELAEALVSALGKVEGTRAAVVAFAGVGRLRCPLTENLGAVTDALKALRAGDVQPGGTNLGAGLDAALEALGTVEHADGRTIVLFSDGEDHEADWSSRMEPLRRAGAQVHCVAIGDAAGGHQVPSSESSPAPLLYQGEPVQSRRVDRALEAIAQATGGALIPVGVASTKLGRLYETRIAPVARERREEFRPPARLERFSLFLFLAVVLGFWTSWQANSSWPGRLHWHYLLVVLVLLGASPLEHARNETSLGLTEYAQGRFDKALEHFTSASRSGPNNPLAHYNLAAALYQLGRYDDALNAYARARVQADNSLRTKIDFALGNTALANGDLLQALAHYDECLASAEPGRSMTAVRSDAAENRRYAELQLQQRPDMPEDPSDPSSSSKTGPSSRDDEAADQAESKNDSMEPNPENSPSNEPTGAGTQKDRGSKSLADRTTSADLETPDGQLNAALRAIRDARSRRLTDPPSQIDDLRKNW